MTLTSIQKRGVDGLT